MASESQRVVILYAHPLFGEGIGHLLKADPDLEVELVLMDDVDAAERALSAGPDVVILERTAPFQAIDLLRWAPSALFIDVGLDAGPSWTYRREALASEPKELLRVIRGRQEHGVVAVPIAADPVLASTAAGRRPRALRARHA